MNKFLAKIILRQNKQLFRDDTPHNTSQWNKYIEY